jgi:integrase
MPNLSRRTLKAIERKYSPEEVLELIQKGRPWKYKRDAKKLQTRDRAIMSFMYLMACRVNESLKVHLNQFDFTSDPQFIVVKDFRISKRKPKTIKKEGIPRIDFGLPIEGRFKPFTDMTLEWFYIREKEAPDLARRLFPIHRTTAWRRVEYITGKWDHWFRSQRLSYLMNKFRSETIVAKMTGIKNPGTISHYYQGHWKDHKEDLL